MKFKFDKEAYIQKAATLLKLPANLDPRSYQGDDLKEIMGRCNEALDLRERYGFNTDLAEKAKGSKGALSPGPAMEEADDIAALALELAVKLRGAGPDLRECIAVYLPARVLGIDLEKDPLAVIRDPKTYPPQPDDLVKYLKALAAIAQGMAHRMGQYLAQGVTTIGGRLTPDQELWRDCNELADRCGCTKTEARKLAYLVAGKRLHEEGKKPVQTSSE